MLSIRDAEPPFVLFVTRLAPSPSPVSVPVAFFCFKVALPRLVVKSSSNADTSDASPFFTVCTFRVGTMWGSASEPTFIVPVFASVFFVDAWKAAAGSTSSYFESATSVKSWNPRIRSSDTFHVPMGRPNSSSRMTTGSLASALSKAGSVPNSAAAAGGWP